MLSPEGMTEGKTVPVGTFRTESGVPVSKSAVVTYEPAHAAVVLNVVFGTRSWQTSNPAMFAGPV